MNIAKKIFKCRLHPSRIANFVELPHEGLAKKRLRLLIFYITITSKGKASSAFWLSKNRKQQPSGKKYMEDFGVKWRTSYV